MSATATTTKETNMDARAILDALEDFVCPPTYEEVCRAVNERKDMAGLTQEEWWKKATERWPA